MIFEKITMIQIDYFMAVAKHLNFTKAAKNLYVSQPSLSKQVALLEHELGVQLFFRTRREVQLTPAGKSLYEELSLIRGSLKNAFDKARQSALYGSHPIHIGCLEAMDTDVFLPDLIKKFNHQYPDIDVIIERHSFKALREKLIDQSLDVIFTLSFEVDESLDIEYHTVYKTTSSIYMANSHPLAKQKSVSLKDLKNERFVCIDRDECPRGFDLFVNTCRQNGFSPTILKQLPNSESMLLCVKAGLGVCILDTHIRIHNRHRFKTYELPSDILSIVMIMKKDNKNDAVQKLTACLLEKVKPNIPDRIPN